MMSLLLCPAAASTASPDVKISVGMSVFLTPSGSWNEGVLENISVLEGTVARKSADDVAFICSQNISAGGHCHCGH